MPICQPAPAPPEKSVLTKSPSAVMKTPRQLWFRQENFGNIRIGLVDDVLSVSIGIILCRGAKAVSVAEEIQDKVKSAVQNMLGLTVAKVNVTICGVDLSEKE